MSDWRDYLNDLGEKVTEAWDTFNDKPGEVMICFVNRYLEGMDDIKYKIHQDLKIIEGKTTASRYCVALSPTSLKPIEVYVWSRKKNDYKKLDDVVPEVGNKKLVRKIIKSYKAAGKTEKHPANAPIVAPPKRPAPAPAPAPSPTDKQGVRPLPKPDESGLPQTQVERLVPDKITKEQLKKIFPKAELPYLQQIADELNVNLRAYGLNTQTRRAHFFAQVREEAGAGLVANVESLNYTPQALKKFKYYQKHPMEIKQDARLDAPKVKGKKSKPLQIANQTAIANKVYSKRGGNGDVESGDGWRYRGRGFIQLTFKKSYEQFYLDYGKYWKDTPPNFLTDSEKVKDFPYNIRSAVWFWVSHKLPQLADDGNTPEVVNKITAVINLYTDSYGSRRANFVVSDAAFK